MTTADYRKTVKAIEIANSGGVIKADGVYFVASQANGAYFRVEHTAHKWTCTCQHFATGNGRMCKHILAAFKVEDKANMRAGA